MVKRPGNGNRAPNKWQTSKAFRSIASAAITEWNEQRRHLPKCGARRKHDGQPCQQDAMENGRCAVHGGKTPKGDQWHRRQWPTKDGPAAERKLQAKQAQIERQTAALEKRLAAMSPDERRAYDDWVKAHTPGSRAAREAKKRDKQTAQEIQALLERPEPEPLPEVARIAADIAKLKSKIERLKRKPDDEATP